MDAILAEFGVVDNDVVKTTDSNDSLEEEVQPVPKKKSSGLSKLAQYRPVNYKTVIADDKPAPVVDEKTGVYVDGLGWMQVVKAEEEPTDEKSVKKKVSATAVGIRGGDEMDWAGETTTANTTAAGAAATAESNKVSAAGRTRKAGLPEAAKGKKKAATTNLPPGDNSMSWLDNAGYGEAMTPVVPRMTPVPESSKTTLGKGKVAEPIIHDSTFAGVTAAEHLEKVAQEQALAAQLEAEKVAKAQALAKQRAEAYKRKEAKRLEQEANQYDYGRRGRRQQQAGDGGFLDNEGYVGKTGKADLQPLKESQTFESVEAEETGESSTAENNDYVCFLCEAVGSEMWCEQCNSYLCDVCNADYHNSNGKFAYHIVNKVEIDDKTRERLETRLAQNDYDSDGNVSVSSVSSESSEEKSESDSSSGDNSSDDEEVMKNLYGSKVVEEENDEKMENTTSMLSPPTQKCDVCGKADAVLYCPQCDRAVCTLWDCDQDIHRALKNRGHHRFYIKGAVDHELMERIRVLAEKSRKKLETVYKEGCHKHHHHHILADEFDLCTLCEEAPVTIGCRNCKEYFCEEQGCDGDMHLHKKKRQHMRYLLKPRPPVAFSVVEKHNICVRCRKNFAIMSCKDCSGDMYCHDCNQSYHQAEDKVTHVRKHLPQQYVHPLQPLEDAEEWGADPLRVLEEDKEDVSHHHEKKMTPVSRRSSRTMSGDSIGSSNSKGKRWTLLENKVRQGLHNHRRASSGQNMPLNDSRPQSGSRVKGHSRKPSKDTSVQEDDVPTPRRKLSIARPPDEKLGLSSFIPSVQEAKSSTTHTPFPVMPVRRMNSDSTKPVLRESGRNSRSASPDLEEGGLLAFLGASSEKNSRSNSTSQHRPVSPPPGPRPPSQGRSSINFGAARGSFSGSMTPVDPHTRRASLFAKPGEGSTSSGSSDNSKQGSLRNLQTRPQLLPQVSKETWQIISTFYDLSLSQTMPGPILAFAKAKTRPSSPSPTHAKPALPAKSRLKNRSPSELALSVDGSDDDSEDTDSEEVTIDEVVAVTNRLGLVLDKYETLLARMMEEREAYVVLLEANDADWAVEEAAIERHLIVNNEQIKAESLLEIKDLNDDLKGAISHKKGLSAVLERAMDEADVLAAQSVPLKKMIVEMQKKVSHLKKYNKLEHKRQKHGTSPSVGGADNESESPSRKSSGASPHGSGHRKHISMEESGSLHSHRHGRKPSLHIDTATQDSDSTDTTAKKRVPGSARSGSIWGLHAERNSGGTPRPGSSSVRGSVSKLGFLQNFRPNSKGSGGSERGSLISHRSSLERGGYKHVRSSSHQQDSQGAPEDAPLMVFGNKSRAASEAGTPFPSSPSGSVRGLNFVSPPPAMMASVGTQTHGSSVHGPPGSGAEQSGDDISPSRVNSRRSSTSSLSEFNLGASAGGSHSSRHRSGSSRVQSSLDFTSKSGLPTISDGLLDDADAEGGAEEGEREDDEQRDSGTVLMGKEVKYSHEQVYELSDLDDSTAAGGGGRSAPLDNALVFLFGKNLTVQKLSNQVQQASLIKREGQKPYGKFQEILFNSHRQPRVLPPSSAQSRRTSQRSDQTITTTTSIEGNNTLQEKEKDVEVERAKDVAFATGLADANGVAEDLLAQLSAEQLGKETIGWEAIHGRFVGPRPDGDRYGYRPEWDEKGQLKYWNGAQLAFVSPYKQTLKSNQANYYQPGKTVDLAATATANVGGAEVAEDKTELTDTAKTAGTAVTNNNSKLNNSKSLLFSAANTVPKRRVLHIMPVASSVRGAQPNAAGLKMTGPAPVVDELVINNKNDGSSQNFLSPYLSTALQQSEKTRLPASSSSLRYAPELPFGTPSLQQRLRASPSPFSPSSSVPLSLSSSSAPSRMTAVDLIVPQEGASNYEDGAPLRQGAVKPMPGGRIVFAPVRFLQAIDVRPSTRLQTERRPEVLPGLTANTSSFPNLLSVASFAFPPTLNKKPTESSPPDKKAKRKAHAFSPSFERQLSEVSLLNEEFLNDERERADSAEENSVAEKEEGEDKVEVKPPPLNIGGSDERKPEFVEQEDYEKEIEELMGKREKKTFQKTGAENWRFGKPGADGLRPTLSLHEQQVQLEEERKRQLDNEDKMKRSKLVFSLRPRQAAGDGFLSRPGTSSSSSPQHPSSLSSSAHLPTSFPNNSAFPAFMSSPAAKNLHGTNFRTGSASEVRAAQVAGDFYRVPLPVSEHHFGVKDGPAPKHSLTSFHPSAFSHSHYAHQNQKQFDVLGQKRETRPKTAAAIAAMGSRPGTAAASTSSTTAAGGGGSKTTGSKSSSSARPFFGGTATSRKISTAFD